MSDGPDPRAALSPMSVLAGTRLGRYDILSPIGAGGMGEVYRGLDTQLGRDVALKVLPEALGKDPDRLSRFEREARAVSALNHPNIVTVHEIGREGQTAFLAMELVEGETLRKIIEPGALAPRRALAIAAQIADGLAQAHAAGVVHRDLKPENVMVTKDGRVKILDFGLARMTPLETTAGEPTVSVPDDATRPGALLGTVSYMSPEQASGRPVDFRSDQFSLGTILHEMLAGRRTWRRGSAAETLAAILRDEAPPLEVPADVRKILDRCLAKDPEERYGSTRDLARDLASASGPSARADALPSRAEAHRRVLPAVASLALLAAAAATGWILGRATSSRATPPTYQRLTFRRGVVGNARLAPDGRTVVYGATWGEAPGPSLFLTRTDNPAAQAFDFGAADILSISRSSELAVLLGSGVSGTLAVVPLLGGHPRPRVEGVVYSGADWTPDGRELAVVRRVDGRDQLEFPIGSTLVADGAESPRFSPSGERLAFFEPASQGPSFEVSTIGARGGAKTVLSTGWADIAGAPCWTPDGREIWFTAAERPGETTALWAVDLSGRRRLVLRTPGGLELDDIGRDGRVLFQHFTGQQGVWSQSAGEPPRELSWLDGSTVADLAADGKTALLNETGEGAEGPTIYLRGTDGSPPVRLGRGTGMALSPDGRWVLASGGASSGLSLVPTGTGETKPLPRGGLKDFNWGAFLPGGEGVVFSAVGPNGLSRVYVQMLRGGEPRPISPEKTWIAAFTNPVSADGKSVVVSSGTPAWGAADHALYPLDGSGEARPIPGLSRGEVPVQWSDDSRALYVIRRGDRPARVWRLDVASGARTSWKDISGPSQGVFAIRLTPDGRTVVYGGALTSGTLYLASGLR